MSRDEGTQAGAQRKSRRAGGRRDEANPSLRSAIRTALESVCDPEIPVLNVIDLGIIAAVRDHGPEVTIDVTPTFVGCPALELMRERIREAVSAATGTSVVVNVVYDPPWTSDRISEEGRRKLREFGFAPPSGAPLCGSATVDLEHVRCPWCNSGETDLDSIFGPTLCRSLHFCRSCRQSFEHFKPV